MRIFLWEILCLTVPRDTKTLRREEKNKERRVAPRDPFFSRARAQKQLLTSSCLLQRISFAQDGEVFFSIEIVAKFAFEPKFDDFAICQPYS